MHCVEHSKVNQIPLDLSQIQLTSLSKKQDGWHRACHPVAISTESVDLFLLPHLHSLFRLQIHAVSRLDIKCLVELVQTLERPVAPELVGGVGVQCCQIRPHLTAGGAAPGPGHALIQRLIIRLRLLALDLGDAGKGSQVGHVLADGQLTVARNAGNGLHAVVESRHLAAQGLECSVVLLRPPVALIPLGVELGAGVVKGMGDFMSDDIADAA